MRGSQIALCLALSFLFGFGLYQLSSDLPNDQGAKLKLQRIQVSDQDVQSVSNSLVLLNNDFLEGLLSQDSNKNIFISPYSLSIALSMTASGARGETEEEMWKTLRIDLDPETSPAAYSNLIEKLGLQQKTDGFEIAVANKLWIEKTIPVKEEFLLSTKTFFFSETSLADFSRSAAAESKKINDWASKETRGRIQSIVPDLPSSTVMVLANAIYFKANWLKSFDKKKTYDTTFKTFSGEEVQVKMMSEKSKIKLLEEDDFTIFQKLYVSPKGKQFGMTFLLPKEEGLSGFSKSFAFLNSHPEYFSTFLNAPEIEIPISIPKFTYNYDFQASGLLKKMGMVKAFGAADFSGIFQHHKAQISEVYHKAFIEVNEEGSEAAAVTAVVLTKMALFQKSVLLDRPFMFFITENFSSSILFSGIVVKPN